MSLTVGRRTTTAAGVALLVMGLALSTHGALTHDAAHAMAGAAVTFVSTTLIALGKIKRWVTDTNAERRALARATLQAEQEQMRFLALQSAGEAEMTRLRHDVAAERAEVAKMLVTERAAMEAALERSRLELQKEAFQTGVRFERAGMLEADPPKGNLIRFPMQHPEVDPVPQRERSREHGVVGP